jgi:hypothetical protein
MVRIVDILQAAYRAFIHHTVGRLFRSHNSNNISAAAAAAKQKNAAENPPPPPPQVAAAEDHHPEAAPQPQPSHQQQQQNAAAITATATSTTAVTTRMSTNYVPREMTFEQGWAKIKPFVSILLPFKKNVLLLLLSFFSLSLSVCLTLASQPSLLYLMSGRGQAASQVGRGHDDWSREYESVHSS